MKAKPEYVEGPEAWQRFNAAMHKALTVSHDELQRRITREREASKQETKEPANRLFLIDSDTDCFALFAALRILRRSSGDTLNWTRHGRPCGPTITQGCRTFPGP